MTSQRNVSLKSATREDVSRVSGWLADDAASAIGFGVYSSGEAAHYGGAGDAATDEEFAKEIEDPARVTLSVYDAGDHVGEVHIHLEEGLGDGQLSMIFGSRRHWRGCAAAGLRAALAVAFGDYGLYRVWAEIPESNFSARSAFEAAGFHHEGTLRKGGEGADLVVLGLLAADYSS